ncbi:conjugal transfer protein TraM [Duganella sp. BuS-21]|uniref:conjugal transfer protein TraM n=1 Tax=Duganella sp. BuS-21 TaxID=2943848 RepID=UPI0035A721E7
MSDQIEDLIREIASKHGIAVARDDPILVLQTINNRLLQDSAMAQQALLDKFKEELEAISLRWQTDSKEKAERVLTAALATSKTAMEHLLHDGAMKAAKLTKSEVEKIFEQVLDRAREARQTALINLAASGLTVTGVLVAVFSMN